MTPETFIQQVKIYGAKDRIALKNKLLQFNFDGKDYRNWKRYFAQVVDNQPFKVEHCIQAAFVKKLTNQEAIDWEDEMIGDISWEIMILLNEKVQKGHDWDSKLCLACGGTARILRILISDLMPAFIWETYSMTHTSKDNYYEFQAIQPNYAREKTMIKTIVSDLKQKGFYFVHRKLANKRFPELHSDCNRSGNASIYDVLFSDVRDLQTTTLRFNDKNLKDLTGKEYRWREYYDKKGLLYLRKEYQFFDSKNVLLIETDGKKDIKKITVWKDTEKASHQEFKLRLPPMKVKDSF